MKTIKLYLSAFALGTALLAAHPLRGAEAKTYQVTGPVLELTPTMIVVQKGDDKWQIARGAAKVTGELKVGAKVTIEYQMVAKTVEVKADKK
jgi:RNase P/RNase MRP subunit p29